MEVSTLFPANDFIQLQKTFHKTRLCTGIKNTRNSVEHTRFLINEIETNRSKYRIHEEIFIIVVNAFRNKSPNWKPKFQQDLYLCKLSL
jgi:hypothetical protein